jgi:3-isopropylmalate/(R)-2-methylmalate dehydratase small subunit
MSAPQLTTRGRVWRLGDLVNIDEVCATRHLTKTRDVWAEYTFEGLIPGFRERVHAGDVVIAGSGFAYGMGHDHPILGMMECGIFGVIAKSFGPQFYRACIAHGMPLMEVDEELADVVDGSTVEADFEAGRLLIEDTGRVVQCVPLGGTALEIVQSGNLVSFLRGELQSA